MAVRPAIAAMLRRLSRSPHRDDLVVRGGVVTAALVAPHPRLVEDLDLLWRRDRFDARQLRALVAEIAGLDDPQPARLVDAEVIWAETEWPGLRAEIEIAGERLQLDVGFGDPLIDGPVETELVPGCPLLVCRPETLVAWKVHGLFERGPGRWRPKDLHDIDLLIRHADLDRARVSASLAAAFSSRDTELSVAARLGRGELGTSDWSARKWRRFVETRPAGVDPGPLAEVVARVSAYLAADLVV